ncbi:hypothetical protein [uncultured Croceitalea sp.]|uniref:hypothetical protein n=1 Tax=uncultured Croceitalea sp. TaxID=1798908 RepID=UPI003306834F
MKKLFLLILSSVSYLYVEAHPGIGMVYDGERFIYYTDLKHVWKLDTKSGMSEIFVEDVHTHELALDRSGHLYGEHYWYVESEQKFKNYIWRANKVGVIQKIREDQYGENHDFSFVRDRQFSSYEIRKGLGEHEIVLKDTLQEKVLAQLTLDNPTWKYLSDNDDFLFVDYPSIYVFKHGAVSIISEDVSSTKFPFSFVGKEHNIYGIWTDKSQNTYVAIYGGREIRKITKNTEDSRLVKTGLLWSPVNGVFDNDNNLWIMECKIGGKIRVRKITQNKLLKKSSFLVERVIFAAILLLLTALSVCKLKVYSSSYVF